MCNQFSTFLQNLAQGGLPAALGVFGVTGVASGGFFLAAIACLGGATLLGYVRAKRAEAFRQLRERVSQNQIKDIHDFISALQDELKLTGKQRISLASYQQAANDPESLDKDAATAIAETIRVVTEEVPGWVDEFTKEFERLNEKMDQRWEMHLASFDTIRNIELMLEDIRGRLVAPAAPVSRRVLPRLPGIYVRRKEKLEALHQCLNRAGVGVATAVVAASGFGGYGKSLLAIGYAHEYGEEHYPGGVYFVPVGSAAIETAMETLGTELRLPGLSERTSEAAEQVRQHLESIAERSLLIVDNVGAEQWRDRGFRAHLPAGKVSVLVTTQATNLLPPGQTVRVERLTMEEAVELLGQFRKDAKLAEHREAVERLVNAVEGIAVGVAAVGAYLGIHDTLGFGGYAKVLETQEPDRMPDGLADVSGQIDYRPDWGGETPNGQLVLALRDAYEAQSGPARLILDLAAALPQDLAPKPWIQGAIKILVDAGVMSLEATPGYGDATEPHFAVLAKGDFLRESEGAAQVLVMHRLHRGLIRVRLGNERKGLAALQVALARAARERVPEWGYQDRWREAERRWEVEPVIAFGALFANDALSGPAAASAEVLHTASMLADMAGRLEWALGRSEAARKSFERGLIACREVVKQQPDDQTALRNLSLSLSQVGDVERAIRGPEAAVGMYREALEISRKIIERYGETPGATPLSALRDVSVSLGKVGDVELETHGPEAAVGMYREALEISRKIIERYGETPGGLRDVSVSLEKVGDVELETSGPGAAAGMYREALEIRRKIIDRYGETPEGLRDVSVSLGKVGDVELETHGPEAAVGMYREALEISRKIIERYGETPEATPLWALRDVSVSLGKVGDVELETHGPEAAVGMYREALEIDTKIIERYGETPEGLRDVAVSLNKVGDVERATHGAEAAEGLYREALEIRRKIIERYGETPQGLRDVAVSLQRTGYVNAKMGDKAGGLADAREALRGFEEVGRRYGMSWQIKQDIEITKGLIEEIEGM